MRLQFSVRTFLLIVVVFSAFLGTVGTRVVRRKQSIDKIVAAGGRVLYKDQFAIPNTPKVRAGGLIEHWFYPVSYVVLRPNDDVSVDMQLKWLSAAGSSQISGVRQRCLGQGWPRGDLALFVVEAF